MSDNIISLADQTDRGDLRSPESMFLEVAADHADDGINDNKKAMAISLDTANGEYNISWYQAGMKCSEMLTMLEVTKAIILRDMGY